MSVNPFAPSSQSIPKNLKKSKMSKMTKLTFFENLLFRTPLAPPSPDPYMIGFPIVGKNPKN